MKEWIHVEIKEEYVIETPIICTPEEFKVTTKYGFLRKSKQESIAKTK